MYDPFAYGIAIAVVELPYLLVQALCFVPIAYWMIAFQASAAKFFYYLLMFLATITFYTIFGQFLVYVTPSMQLAQVGGLRACISPSGGLGSGEQLFGVMPGMAVTAIRRARAGDSWFRAAMAQTAGVITLCPDQTVPNPARTLAWPHTHPAPSPAPICPPSSQVLGGALNFFFNIFNGFVITYPDFPVYWQWMNRAVPTTW